jgi:hypothetical protein
MRKLIISFPAVLATILTITVSSATTVAYGQDFLIGSPDDPVLNSTESQELIARNIEAERQQYLQQQQQQQQQQQPPPVAITTAAPQAQVPEGFLEYRSPVFGAVINYPSDWEVRPPSNTVRGFSLFQVFAPEGEQGSFTGDRPNLNLEVAEERGAMASYEARAWLEERAFRLMTQHEQFDITASAPTTVAGREGWTLSVTFTSLLDGEEYTNKQWMVGTGGRTYLLTYHSPVESFDEYLPQVQQMIASFRVE